MTYLFSFDYPGAGLLLKRRGVTSADVYLSLGVTADPEKAWKEWPRSNLVCLD